MHYYKHNIADYRKDTGHLSLLEHGVYRQLLDLYYLDERPIPLETDWVIRRLSARTQEEATAIRAVLDDFFERTEEGYRHTRCDLELRSYAHKAEANKANGKQGGRPKKTQSVSDGNPSRTQKNLNHKPLTTISTSLRSVDSAVALLVERGVAEQVARDWMQVRKDKGVKTLTPTALAGVEAEAAKAGVSLGHAIRIAAESSWQGFKASWYERLKQESVASRQGAVGSARPVASGGKYAGAAAAIFGDERNGREVIDV